MSNNEQSIIYSEVYGILNMLGDNYINSLPKKLYNYIKENRNANYTPIYDINIPLFKQNIKKRTASFLCMLHYKYWCKTVEEKAEIVEILNDNEKKCREKYNVENVFKNNERIEIDKVQEITVLIEKKENIFTKLFIFIKNFFRNNKRKD